MKYKVGDKVRIVKKRCMSMNIHGQMDMYLGTIMTIDAIIDNYYEMVEDDGKWYWVDTMIDYLVERI